MFEAAENSDLIGAIEASHGRVSHAQSDLLSLIAEVDRQEAWLTRAHALEELPRLADALIEASSGSTRSPSSRDPLRPRPKRNSSVGRRT